MIFGEGREKSCNGDVWGVKMLVGGVGGKLAVQLVLRQGAGTPYGVEGMWMAGVQEEVLPRLAA